MSPVGDSGNPQEDEQIVVGNTTTTTANTTATHSHSASSSLDGSVGSNNDNNDHLIPSRMKPRMFRSRLKGDAAAALGTSTPERKRRRRRRSRSTNLNHNTNNSTKLLLSAGGGGTMLTATSADAFLATSPGGGNVVVTNGIGNTTTTAAGTTAKKNPCQKLFSCLWRWLTRSPTVPANAVPTQHVTFSSPRTSRCMGCLARGVLWTTIVALTIGVIWYSFELFHHGAEPHLVAWFSAGGFVLLGFPISMWAIISHLANYNQPHVQVYIVRILWMVPLYSVGSWLAMRFRSYAIYIETVRDLYESYVLYSFLQFLIQVLGGEEALVLMLKDKSPTRGVHMWGLQWCVKPWLMGQPYRKTMYEHETTSIRGNHGGTASSSTVIAHDPLVVENSLSDGAIVSLTAAESGGILRPRAVKRVVWKSPFFVKCKFGVLQYVLLKFVSAICIMILEHLKLYHEGDFSPRGGYLYICFVTNLSQCWALYCLVFFYYATKNELSPIRPVGKFLSVKALVFFTWWQSVMISIFLEMNMIPEYSMHDLKMMAEYDKPDNQDWTPEDVAKVLQDYLICVEMFLIAIVHSFVFPHSEYTPQAVEARARALNLAPMTKWHKRRLGRTKYSSQYLLFGGSHRSSNDDLSLNTNSLDNDAETELVSLTSESEISGWNSSAAQFTNETPQSPGRGRFGSDEETGGGMIVDPIAASDTPTTDNTNRSGKTSVLDDVTEREEEDDEDDDDDDDEEYDDDDYEDTDSGDYVDDSDGDVVFGEGDNPNTSRNQLPTVSSTSLGTSHTTTKRPGFIKAFLESAIPTDMVDSTVGIVKGEYNIERKTLLNHATASDQYDLFSPNRRPFVGARKKAKTDEP